MRIYFERTGGVAGMRLTATVNTDTLPPEEARDLRKMVDDARFFELPAKIATPARGADQFHYRLTVEVDARRHTVEMGEAAAPVTLRPLLRQLTAVARSARGSP